MQLEVRRSLPSLYLAVAICFLQLPQLSPAGVLLTFGGVWILFSQQPKFNTRSEAALQQ
jgi:hypothetical protein